MIKILFIAFGVFIELKWLDSIYKYPVRILPAVLAILTLTVVLLRRD
jgi:hypothetical protein